MYLTEEIKSVTSTIIKILKELDSNECEITFEFVCFREYNKHEQKIPDMLSVQAVNA